MRRAWRRAQRDAHAVAAARSSSALLDTSGVEPRRHEPRRGERLEQLALERADGGERLDAKVAIAREGKLGLAARRVASAYAIRLLGFDETTKNGNPSITSNVIIEPTEGAVLEPVILRGAYCSAGGTSELIAKAIEEKCFTRLRDFLRRWKVRLGT